MAVIMSRFMRDLLIEHIDGPCRYVEVPLAKTLGKQSYIEPVKRHQRRLLLLRCLNRGWLALDNQVNPTCTSLTDKGKQDLCVILAEWADCLTRAGFALEDRISIVASPQTANPKVSVVWLQPKIEPPK